MLSSNVDSQRNTLKGDIQTAIQLVNHLAKAAHKAAFHWPRGEPCNARLLALIPNIAISQLVIIEIRH